MKRLILFATLAVIVAVGAVVGGLAATHRSTSGSSGPQTPYKGNPPPPGIPIPNVTIPSYRGGKVRLRGLAGTIVVLTFLDSKCTDTCPIITALIGRTWPQLTTAEKQQTRAYAISVNPHADTRRNIRRFLTARHATGALDWLVAPVKQMRPVWHDFGVLPSIDTGSDNIHSADVRVFNRKGIWVSTLHAGVDLTPTNLAHDIRLAMKS